MLLFIVISSKRAWQNIINYPLKQNLSYIMATRMTSPILDNTLNNMDTANVDPGWMTSPVNDLKEAGWYKEYP